MGVKRVLVGWDGSPDSRQALRVGCELAHRLDGEVVVLEVVHPPFSPESTHEGERELARHRSDLGATLFSNGHHNGATNSLSPAVIAADDTAHALCEYVSKHGFDLLVVGRHGVDAAVHPHIGRVTEFEVRNCACPVLVVSAQ